MSLPGPRFMVPLCLAAALLASGCTESQLRLNPDFGVAVRQDAAAQIANPHPRYVGYPLPGSDGSRAALAEKRYTTGKVIPPASSTIGSKVIGAESSGTGGGDEGGGTAPPPSPQ